MKKIYIIIGSIALLIGIIGIVLPVLPTTPFLLLTSFCYAKGSERFYNWFIKTKIYKNHLESFVENRSMTVRTKASTLSLASFMLLFPLFLTDSIHLRIFIIFLYIFKYYYILFRVKTAKERAR
ncbi:MAG: YbaN family protein [Clostridia bacterium]|nr:YbaN family protein [Clostridia bacterium]